MNAIEVIGGKRAQREAVHSMIDFCIRTLMPRMRTLDITVELSGGLQEWELGFCATVDTCNRPRAFEIELNKNALTSDILATIAHEMVHVKQYARGELVTRGLVHYWKGERHSDTDYNNRPWEIEAHSLDEHLYQQWLAQTNSTIGVDKLAA